MVGGKQFPRGGAEPVPERAGKGKAARIVELRRRFLVPWGRQSAVPETLSAPGNGNDGDHCRRSPPAPPEDRKPLRRADRPDEFPRSIHNIPA